MLFRSPSSETCRPDELPHKAALAEDAAEIVAYVTHLAAHPETARNLRIAAQRTARDFTWQRVLDILLQRLEFVALKQGLKVAGDAQADVGSGAGPL